MAFLKSWAPRSHNRMRLRVPELLAGQGIALRGDAVDLVTSGRLGPDSFDIAYLDPPYNQHSYPANYHVWETIVAGDRPEHYGVACKRVDTRGPANASAFNRRATLPRALATVLAGVDARVVALSYNDEAWMPIDALLDLCAAGGRRHVEAVSFDSPRYVGARIGIHNPAGERVGAVSHVRNLEYLIVSGPDRAVVERAFDDVAAAPPGRALSAAGPRRR
jgi:adenine-specific DNA-methyltransferase